MNLARMVVLSVLLAAPLAHARADCLAAGGGDQQAEGKLDQIEFTDEAYDRTETAFILVLLKPACLTGQDEYDKVESASRIHVFSMDHEILRQLRANVGKKVNVTGSAFGEQTAHHHAPIVMNVSAIVRR